MNSNFRGGGLKIEPNLLTSKFRLSSPEDFVTPSYIDSRPYCLPASNQGPYPHCAGYATAGYIEVQNWKSFGIAKQVDGNLIYAEAKKVDGDPSDGTTLTAAVQGAKNLNLLDPKLAVTMIVNKQDLKFAIHKHLVCIAGFNISEGWREPSSATGYIGSKDNPLGGHAILICWYDEAGVGWQNSWDISWGFRGFGRMTWEQFDRQFVYAVVLE